MAPAPAPASLLDELRAGVRAPVSTAPDDLEGRGHGFGGLVRRVPSVVVQARCEADVVHTLEAVLNAAGRTMPVLTSSLDTTVGGTLSAGGFGSRSLHFGAQVDSVESLRLILPDGSAVWCGPEQNAELLRFSLAGFGQVGVIERVVMRTVPFQPVTRLQLNPHQGLGALVDAVGLYYGVRVEDRRGLEAAVAAHRQCLEWTVAAGGRPYLHGRHPLAPESRAALYGGDLARLRALRAAQDPDGLLNPHGLHWGDLAAEGAR